MRSEQCHKKTNANVVGSLAEGPFSRKLIPTDYSFDHLHEITIDGDEVQVKVDLAV